MTKAGRKQKTKHCLYAKWKLNYMNLYPSLLCLSFRKNKKVSPDKTSIGLDFKNTATKIKANCEYTNF